MFLHTLSTNGPMARCPRDLALLLEVQAGFDPHQGLGLPGEIYQDRLEVDLTGRRIGWLGDWGGAYPTDPGLVAHCRAQLAQFSDLGCQIDDIAQPFDAALLWQSWTTLRSWAVSQGLGPIYATDPDALKPEAVWEIERGLALSAAQINAASAIRSDWMRCAAELFFGYDALVLPTAQVWPFPVEWDWPKSIAGKRMDTYHRWMEIVIPAGLIGLPAVAVPCAPGPTGLPIGLQLIGAARDDVGMLQLAQGWDDLTRLKA